MTSKVNTDVEVISNDLTSTISAFSLYSGSSAHVTWH